MLAALALPLLAAAAYAADVCNGDASLCERKYSNVTYIGTHNSYGVGDSPAANQNKDVTAQLNDGVRALQIQTHDNNGTIHVCHTSCGLLDGGSLQDYLSKVASWISANPKDVVTLVMVNIDNKPASEFATVFSAVGLDKKAYAPPSAQLPVSGWPTLGSMIDAGTTLVAFLDNQADTTTTPYIIDEFTNMWETAYDVTDQTWNCSVGRTKGTPNSQMYMINHFLDMQVVGILMPDKNRLNETNAASGPGSIGAQVDNCLMDMGRAPNIILLDYYDSNGNAPFQVANNLNGISAAPAEVTPYTKTAPAAASGTGGSSTNTEGTNANVSSKPINANGGAGARAATVGVAGVVAAAAMALLL